MSNNDVPGQPIAANALFAPFTPPFFFDPNGPCILDSHNIIVADIHGWGYLTGGGNHALGLSQVEAASIQNKIGRALAESMNRSSANPLSVRVEAVVGSDSDEVCALKNQCIDLSFEIAALTLRLSDACDHIDKLVATMECKRPPGHLNDLRSAHTFAKQVREVWIANPSLHRDEPAAGAATVGGVVGP